MYFQVHKIFMANKVWPENAMLQCLHLECDTKVFGLDILGQKIIHLLLDLATNIGLSRRIPILWGL
jgi:hypothetical protein